MKKTILLIALALTSASLSSAAQAGVCAGKAEYDVTVGGTPAGTASFTVETLPTTGQAGFYGAQASCGYALDWTRAADTTKADDDPKTSEASCDVAQSIFGQSSCDAAEPPADGSTPPLPIVTSFSAPLYSVAGCQGFDAAGALQKVSFVLSPGGAACGMNGLITFALYPYMIQGISFT